MDDIKVAIADDQKTFRQSLVRVLQYMEELDVVVEAGNGRELLAGLKDHPADVVLLDLNMPEMDGVAATMSIRQQFPEIKIIILSQYDDDSHIIHLVETGAHAYLTKNAELEEIKAAIISVHEKGFYFNDRVNMALLNRMARLEKVKALFNSNTEFSEIELTVLRLLCEQKSSLEISESVFRSVRTVEGIRQRMLDKTGTKNIVGLVLYAINKKMIDPDEFSI